MCESDKHEALAVMGIIDEAAKVISTVITANHVLIEEP